MDINAIVVELKKERDRLDRAIAALDRETRSQEESRRAGKSTRQRAGGSRMTAAGRKRLSDLMKKRWAERRKKAA